MRLTFYYRGQDISSDDSVTVTGQALELAPIIKFGEQARTDGHVQWVVMTHHAKNALIQRHTDSWSVTIQGKAQRRIASLLAATQYAYSRLDGVIK